MPTPYRRESPAADARWDFDTSDNHSGLGTRRIANTLKITIHMFQPPWAPAQPPIDTFQVYAAEGMDQGQVSALLPQCILDRNTQLRIAAEVATAAAAGLNCPFTQQASVAGPPSKEVAPPQKQPVAPPNEAGEPVYVNTKQFHRIIKRRATRKKLAETRGLHRARKPYYHESRHEHAIRRPRNASGRFLTDQETDILKQGGKLDLSPGSKSGKATKPPTRSQPRARLARQVQALSR